MKKRNEISWIHPRMDSFHSVGREFGKSDRDGNRFYRDYSSKIWKQISDEKDPYLKEKLINEASETRKSYDNREMTRIAANAFAFFLGGVAVYRIFKKEK